MRGLRLGRGWNSSGAVEMSGAGMCALQIRKPEMQRDFLTTFVDVDSKASEQVKRLCTEAKMVEALDLMTLMHQQGVAAPVDTYRFLLQGCSKRRALAEARRLHGLLGSLVMEDDYLGNRVVDMYVKCGGLTDALKAFQQLAIPSVISWAALVSGYANTGQCRQALKVYCEMQKAGVPPDRNTLVSLLKACGSIGDLEEGKRIHADVIERGYGSDLFVGASLVGMYAKCSSMKDAQRVFDALPHHDVALWNALIAGYSQHEQGDKALQLYTQMQIEGVSPTHRTYPCILRAYSSLAAKEDDTLVQGHPVKEQYLKKGKDVHAEVVRRGLEADAFIGNALVHMYARCGSMVDARAVFDKLVKRDSVSWNALIGGYAQQDESDKALELYVEMQEEGVRPTNRTFASLLKACGNLAASEEEALLDGQAVRVWTLWKGKKLHAEMVRRGYEADRYVCSALVHVYANGGDLASAKLVFDLLSDKNVVVWNAMIAGYVQQEQAEAALELFTQLHVKGVRPDSWTFASALKACYRLAAMKEEEDSKIQQLHVEAVQKGKHIHAELVKGGFGSDMFLGNTLVAMYAKCGSLVDARRVFDTLAQVDLVSWGAMISGYSEHEQFDQAWLLYAEMQKAGVRPDNWIFAAVLKACGSLAAGEAETPKDGQLLKVEWLQLGKEVHAEVVRSGCQTDLIVATTLVDMYAKCGDMLQAQQVFDALPDRDVVMWTIIISGYAQQEDQDKALQVYSAMRAAGISPDQATFMFLLKASSNVGDLKMCRQLHEDIIESGVECCPKLTTSLVHAYGMCSSMEEAQHVFNTATEHNVGAWNALIACYARQGDYTMSLKCFEELKVAGVKPDGVTFLCVLAACSHAGVVDKGIQLFESMVHAHSITPTMQHYTCLVDLLGRAGHLLQVQDLLLKMPEEPALPMWLSLLAACRKYNNVAIAESAFEHAVRLDPRHSSAYLLMSSIYAQGHMWEDASTIEDLRQQAGAWKKPGQSWIEHAAKVHKFVAGGKTHEQIADIKSLLQRLNAKLDHASEMSCAPDTTWSN